MFVQTYNFFIISSNLNLGQQMKIYLFNRLKVFQITITSTMNFPVRMVLDVCSLPKTDSDFMEKKKMALSHSTPSHMPNHQLETSDGKHQF